MITRVLFFTSTECPPGEAFDGVIRDVTAEKDYNEIEFKVFDINDEAAQEYIEDMRIDRIPITIFFNEEGKPYKKIIGNVPTRDLKHFLDYELTNEW